MESRATRNVVDPRASLAMWLRAGRAERKLTLDDVARVTKIQPRILEKIEAGNLEGLPAEVFVRGFVKSFARCVGLDEGEAVERYGQCANAVGPSSSVARAFVETLVAAPKAADRPSMLEQVPVPEKMPEASMELAPIAEHPDVEIEVVAEAAPAPTPVIEVIEAPAIEVVEAAEVPQKKAKRSRKKAPGTTTTPRTRKKKNADVVAADGLAVASDPAIELPPVVEMAVEPVVAVADALAPEPTPVTTDVDNAADALFAPSDGIVVEQEVGDDLATGSNPIVADPWTPTMPPVAPTVPWNRPASTATYKPSAFALPSLVIDDADPDLADREREDRAEAAKQGPHRVSFLPPILLDREDKSGRQGGLTLAVILLLIAATLTLSYLMRRPSVSGDGVTQVELVDTSSVA